MNLNSLVQLHYAVDGLASVMSKRKSGYDYPHEPHTVKRSCLYETQGESATIFCYNFNSTANLQQALNELREDGTAHKLNIENLLLSGNDQKVFAVEDFLIQRTMMEIPEEGSFHQPTVTNWKSISFVDNVGTRAKYAEYRQKKKRFIKTLEWAHRKVNRRALDSSSLSLNFRVKLELHAPMDVFTIIRLFQEIVHDPAVQEVQFPDCLQEELFTDSNQAAKAFAAMVDPGTMRWSGPTLTLYISYQDDGVESNHRSEIQQIEEQYPMSNYNRRESRKDQFVRGSLRYNGATVALLKECAINLEKMTLLHSLVGGGKDGSSLSLLSSTNSRRASIDYDDSEF